MNTRKIERILFVRTTGPDQRTFLPPLGILYLIGSLRSKSGGVSRQMKVIDYAFDGFDLRRLSRVFDTFDPDLVAISGLTAETGLIAQTARLAKEKREQRPVVAGGPCVSSDPAHLLSTAQLDAAVLGEGEETLPELVRALESGQPLEQVAGLALPGEETPRLTPPRSPLPNLDLLPAPAWDAIELAGYSAHPRLSMSQSLKRRPYAPIMTSRGCPFGCIYCHKYFGRKIRSRSPEHVLDEMERLYTDFGVREFHLIDDCFNFDLDRAKTICRLISKSTLDVSLAFPNGIRGDRLDRELVEEMKRAGTYKIYFAPESGSPRVQRLIEKNMDLDALARNIALVRDQKIITAGFFMLGFPGETEEEMNETIRFALRSRLDGVNFFKVIPYPGTELAKLWDKTYNRKESGGAGSPFENSGPVDFTQYHFSTRVLPAPAERLRLVDRMFIKAQLKFYGNPLRAWHYVHSHPNTGLALENLRLAYRNIIGYFGECLFRAVNGRNNGERRV